MKRYRVLVAFLLISVSAVANAVTYYVRVDGGTSGQCDGMTDTAFPGGDNHLACAWAHPFWALDDTAAWKIGRGDEPVIGAGSYRMGYGAPNTGWCETDFPWDCHLPPLPSGPDAQHPTRVVGAGWEGGCRNPPGPRRTGACRSWISWAAEVLVPQPFAPGKRRAVSQLRRGQDY